MDGVTGDKIDAADAFPDAVTVMDPFHVVAPAGAKLDVCRQHIQQQSLGRRGHTGDPLRGTRRIARTRLHLLSTHQHDRLGSALDAEEHVAVTLAWLIDQKITAAYADANRRRGKHATTTLINSIRRAMPAGLEEIAQLGRTIWRDATTSWPSSTTMPPTGPPRPSTVAWKPCAAIPLDSRNLTNYR